MKRTENECCDCGRPCMGESCPYWKVTRYYCDRCGEELDEVFVDDDGRELCDCCADELYDDTED